MKIMAVNIPACRFLLLLMLMTMSSNLLLYSSLAAPTSSGTPYPFVTVDGLKTASKTYDYIVVGGGTAGSALSTTLSAKHSVLVIERGGSPYGNPDIEDLSNFGKILGETDNYTSPAQTFISEDGVTLARARVLGGATALNAGFYSRANPGIIRRAQWDKRLVTESYEWVEKQITFQPSPLSRWSSTFRNGLLQAGVLPDNKFTVNHVEGTKVSASLFDNKGKRHTAANLFKSANPKNIVVLLNATVSRIIFGNSTTPRKPKARGVAFTDGKGQSHQVFLKESSPSSEVILSAGALGSPQLLLLSGIGPRQQLKQFNIPLVVDLPGVGQGIQDNPRSGVSVQSPIPLSFSTIQVVGILKGSQNYIFSSLFVQPGNGSVQYSGNILEKVAFPLSRGELRLRTKDPRDNPSVRFNYYSNPQDLQRAVIGVRAIAKILNTPSLQNFTFPATNGSKLRQFRYIGPPLPKNINSNAAVAKFVNQTLNTMWHFHGGAHVGSVVNRQYQVIGVDRLRIVDGSTFKDGPGTNPQATTLMLGRYVGLQILRQRVKSRISIVNGIGRTSVTS